MEKNRTDTALRTGIRVLLAIIFISMWMRIRDYRAVIFDYQRMAETADTSTRLQAQERIERRVGRANYPYDRLPKRPRYPHFWDDYNPRTTESRQRIILDKYGNND